MESNLLQAINQINLISKENEKGTEHYDRVLKDINLYKLQYGQESDSFYELDKEQLITFVDVIESKWDVKNIWFFISNVKLFFPSLFETLSLTKIAFSYFAVLNKLELPDSYDELNKENKRFDKIRSIGSNNYEKLITNSSKFDDKECFSSKEMKETLKYIGISNNDFTSQMDLGKVIDARKLFIDLHTIFFNTPDIYISKIKDILDGKDGSTHTETTLKVIMFDELTKEESKSKKYLKDNYNGNISKKLCKRLHVRIKRIKLFIFNCLKKIITYKLVAKYYKK